MKDKIKKIQNRIDNDPKLKETISSIKPQKTFWGIMGIILFFFLPELITYIWQPELVNWFHSHSLTERLSIQRWLCKQFEDMFASGVSWFNITFGMVMLFWVLRSK